MSHLRNVFVFRSQRRQGLTILPVMAAIVLLGMFLGMLAKRQVSRDQNWRTAVRSAQAKQIAMSQMARLIADKANGQKPDVSQKVFEPNTWPGLKEKVEISISPAPAQSGRFVISVKIPADSDFRFVREHVELP